MKTLVEFCSGCVIRSFEDSTLSTFEIKKKFKEKLLVYLQQERPDLDWSIDTVSCMKFCPENKISISVANRMSVARGTTVEAVGQQILKELK